jgi:uncharacterized lipoprotein YddW (UPF0748 family)
MRMNKKNALVGLILSGATILIACPVEAEFSAAPHITVLDACEYASVSSARIAWAPAEDNTPPVERDDQVGRPMLVFPLNFKSNSSWRVAWDRVGKWDLSPCQTIRLRVRVNGDAPAGMILYLHSGDGWYRANFAAIPGEEAIDLPRKKFEIEDRPGGWEQIDRIRVSVLREDGADRSIALAGLEAIARPASVAVYRNDSGVRAEPAVSEYVRQAGDALDRLAIAYEIVGDEAVVAGRLAGKKVAILPLNPVLSKKSAEGLEKFVAGGGRLIVCYCVPAPLDTLLGIRNGGVLAGEGRLRSFSFESTGQRPAISAIQNSWIAHQVSAGAETKVRAVWTDRAGVVSDEPAVTFNSNGFFVGHVLTAEDQPHKDLLLQEMIGELWPGMWVDVCKTRMEAFGKIAGFKTELDVRQAIKGNRRGSANKAAIDEPLSEASRLMNEAKRALRDPTRQAWAADCLVRAQAALTRAYAASLPSKTGEFRAVWCHRHTGVADLTWDEAIKRLADAGFNAIIPNMCWGNSAAYASRILPRAPGAEHDQLAECLAAAKKYGVAVHVWRVNWNLFGQGDQKQVATLRAAGRLQVDPSGKPIDWLCPSVPENQKLELDAMLEIVRNYDVAGLHFDYIRYPDPNGCFCPVCRKQFEQRLGSVVTNWPSDVIVGSLRQRYLQFRRDNITQLVADVSKQARAIRPTVQISAAVFPDWTSARNEVGQDWKLWVEKGYLDFVCPMQYTDNAGLFEAETQRSAGWVGGRIPLMPGIGATLGLSPDGTLQQILLSRRHAAGFVLFNYEPALLAPLDLLRLGATHNKDPITETPSHDH